MSHLLLIAILFVGRVYCQTPSIPKTVSSTETGTGFLVTSVDQALPLIRQFEIQYYNKHYEWIYKKDASKYPLASDGKPYSIIEDAYKGQPRYTIEFRKPIESPGERSEKFRKETIQVFYVMKRTGEVSRGASISEYASDVRGTSLERISIHPDLPVYIFKLCGDPEFNTIDHIDVSKDGDSQVLQTLKPPDDGTNFIMDPPPSFLDYFQAEDINFDGYKDIKLIYNCGVTGNEWWVYWLFDSKTGTFVFNEGLSRLNSPYPDPATKRIVTFYHGGYMTHTEKMYEIKNNVLILQHEESQYNIPGTQNYVRIISELKDGKMVVVSSEPVVDNQ